MDWLVLIISASDSISESSKTRRRKISPAAAERGGH